MVQVDVFWSYALGAGFALAAGRQLIKSHERCEAEGVEEKPFEGKYFTSAILFLALIFVPSGVWLLWSVPSWETMHVGTYSTIPGWLVVLFVVTNTALGILGYWVTYKLLVSGRHYLAFLQMPLGYFCMFFILVNGWDKRGYQRFFSVTRANFLDWKWSNAASWLTSEVALILGICGLVLVPVLMYVFAKWFKEGYRISDDVDKERAARYGPIRIIALVLAIVFGAALGLAVIATVLIGLIGWVAGLLVFAGAFWLLGVSRWGVLHYFYDRLWLPRPQVGREETGEV